MTPYTERKNRRRRFAVKFGVYFAVLAGVIAQWAVVSFDPKELELDLRMSAWSFARLPVALIVAVIIYQAVDGKGDLEGKVKNWKRALVLGFTSGFTLTGLTGIGVQG